MNIIITVSAILKAQSNLVILVPWAHSELLMFPLSLLWGTRLASYVRFNFPKLSARAGWLRCTVDKLALVYAWRG